MMEYNTFLIVGATVGVSIVLTVAIMWCFFEETEKQKKD